MVKIRRLYIENFLILLKVLGKSKLELQFSDNPMCIIVGKNGSGKSFLMGLITPSPIDLIRNRTSNPAIPGKTGIKELDLELDGKYLYKIKIIYEGKTSCFIHKYNMYNGEDLGEMNPNGNVNTYFDVLDKELGFTKSYLNVGYLSSSVTNIIGMKPAERSSYISIWLPQLSEFLSSFKIVSKKSNVIKRQIDMLNEDIGKLSDTDYDLLITNYSKNIYELEAEFYKYSNDQSKAEAYLKIIKYIEKQELETRIKEFKQKVKLLSQKRIEILDEWKLLSKYSGEDGKKLLQDTLNKCTNNISVLTAKISNIDSNLNNIQTELNEIKSYDKDIDESTIIDIETTIKSLEEDLKDSVNIRSSILKEHPEYSEIENISKTDIDLFKAFIEDLKDIRNKITSLVDSSYLKDNAFITSSNDRIIELKSMYEKQLDTAENKILDITNRIYLLKNSKLDYLLELKPGNCGKVCPIIQEILKYINPGPEIAKLQSELNLLLSNKEELNNKLIHAKEQSQNMKLAFDYINEMNNKVFHKKDLIAKMPNYIKNSFENPDMCAVLNSIPTLFDKIDDYRDYIYLIDKIAISKRARVDIQNQYLVIKQRKSINEKWLKLHENYKKTAENRQNLIDYLNKNETIEKKLKDLNILNEQNNKRIEEYNSEADLLLNEQKLLREYAKNYYIYNSLKDVYDKLEYKINQTKTSLDEYKVKLEGIKNKKTSMSTLIESRDGLLKKKKKYDILADIWSPKIGYPAIQMEEWLDDLTIQTNSDLEKMWGSDLKIERFAIGASEFNISVNRNGSIIKDASECSDGEKATLSLAISFAVIEINLRYRKYNVLRFDELDGPFDSDRRKTFIDVLNNRLPALDCGSAFIISHNNEFGDVPADIIELSKTDERQDYINKTIIYEATR